MYFKWILWQQFYILWNAETYREDVPDSKNHGVHMGPTWVLSAHVGPMNLAIRGFTILVYV